MLHWQRFRALQATCQVLLQAIRHIDGDTSRYSVLLFKQSWEEGCKNGSIKGNMLSTSNLFKQVWCRLTALHLHLQ